MTTSMGQSATRAIPLETQLYIKDLAKFMTALGFGSSEWSQRPAMVPQWNLLISPGNESRFREMLGRLHIDGKPVSFSREGPWLSSAWIWGTKICTKVPQFAVFNGNSDFVHRHGPSERRDRGTSPTPNAYHIPPGMLGDLRSEEYSAQGGPCRHLHARYSPPRS